MKFSIVTPSYNQGEFIERTIESVLSQRGVALEYVVFDGASTDRTVDILKKYGAANGERMRFTSEPDRGQSHAVNKGLRATTGDIIGWLNSDDVYYPGALQAVARHFAAHPEVGVVYGNADHIDVDDRTIEEYPTEAWSLPRMIETCIICQPAAFFRRSVVEAHGLLDEELRYCMDYEYWLRLGIAGVRFDRIEDKVAGSRLYAQNKTLGSRLAVHAEINDMLKKKLGRVPDRWLSNYAHVVANQAFDRTRNPRRFFLTVGIRTLLAALRWNRRISADMGKTVWSWCVRTARQSG